MKATHDKTVSQLSDLQNKRKSSNTTYTDLQKDYNDLQTTYTKLETTYSLLTKSNTDLQATYTDLQTDYRNLETTYTDLQKSHKDLQTTYSKVETELKEPPPKTMTETLEDNKAKEEAQKAKEKAYNLILTSDHGNCEMMRDENGNKLTNHTVGDVYCFIMANNVSKVKAGSLNNIAPTVLELMGLEVPSEMDSSLI